MEEARFSISIREITFREQELNWLFAKYKRLENESTMGADASVEAVKLYHMKLTLAYSSLLARVQKMGNDRRDHC